MPQETLTGSEAPAFAARWKAPRLQPPPFSKSGSAARRVFMNESRLASGRRTVEKIAGARLASGGKTWEGKCNLLLRVKEQENAQPSCKIAREKL